MEQAAPLYPENTDKKAAGSFRRFRERVIATPALMDRLCAETDTEVFIRTMVQLGGEHGELFTEDEVRSALKTSRSEWLLRIML